MSEASDNSMLKSHSRTSHPMVRKIGLIRSRTGKRPREADETERGALNHAERESNTMEEGVETIDVTAYRPMVQMLLGEDPRSIVLNPPPVLGFTPLQLEKLRTALGLQPNNRRHDDILALVLAATKETDGAMMTVSTMADLGWVLYPQETLRRLTKLETSIEELKQTQERQGQVLQHQTQLLIAMAAHFKIPMPPGANIGDAFGPQWRDPFASKPTITDSSAPPSPTADAAITTNMTSVLPARTDGGKLDVMT